jgi:demethylmenaquinone methyltransferase/2-methoxy-6-polyprenyl-1,4-benzoquinol methylase
MLTKVFIGIFAAPVLASILLNFIYEKPPTDHGKGTMFDLIANRYDFINRALALNMDIGWRKVMIAEVTSHGEIFQTNDDTSSVKVLDLATGTADVAILFAKEYRNSNANAPAKRDLEILGVDPSINMITVGREKVSEENLAEQITLDLGDARNLKDLQNDYFDAATMSFGIRNVPEKEQALCEIHRVLKKESSHEDDNGTRSKGAKFGILEFSEPAADSGIMGAGARVFIRYVVPILGAILSGAPREYMHLQNSIKEFPSPKDFAALMEGLSCGEQGDGTFRVDDLIQLNFGSVQLYLATPVYKTANA